MAAKAGADKGMPSPQKGRAYQMGVVLGPPAHGKSSLVEELVLDYRKKGGRTWIVDPARNWKHDKTAFWNGRARLDDDLRKLMTAGPGLLVFDDADGYLRHPSDTRLDFMVAFRHYQKDVVICARRPQGIPKDSISSAEWLALFAIREPYAREYLSKTIGDPKVIRAVPKEKFLYLYVQQETGAHKVYKTKQRAQLSTADVR